MKNRIHSSLLILIALCTLMSCDKKDSLQPTFTIPEKEDTGEPTPNAFSIKAGQKDSGEYYLFEPEIAVKSDTVFYDDYKTLKNIDLNNDNEYDLSFEIIEDIDTGSRYTNSNSSSYYSQEININGINGLQMLTTYENSYYNLPTALKMGDTISEMDNFDESCMLSSFYKESYEHVKDSSFGTGIINQWDTDYYIGFEKYTNTSYSLGWLRFEFLSTTNALTLKDCYFKTVDYE